MLTRTLVLAAVLLLPGPALAATGVPLERAGNDVHNVASLQRGARNFVNYCLGCHSAQFVRWNRVAADLGIPEAALQQNLMFAGGKPFDVIQSAMPPGQATTWLGHAPPDLSLIARSRGTDYVFTYLKSFYADPARPNGINNRVLANTAMPHVLWPLQGLAQPKFRLVTVNGRTEQHLVGLEPGEPGELGTEEFDAFVRDTVNFLDYMGEPVKAKRESLGIWVILFLLAFWLMAWLLKREYWKDVR
jgi:ubiquinol-cytochrome c reductase cytochrome c1 subunit